MTNDIVYFELLRPEKWNIIPAKKLSRYLKLSHGFMQDPDIFMLSNDAKLLFLMLLMQASRCSLDGSYGSVSISLGFASAVLRVPLGSAKGLLKDLDSNNIIRLQKNYEANI